MEMVAASKMRRTQETMKKALPYADKIRAVIGHIYNANPDYKHPFLEKREVKTTGYIVVSSDRGLCGGLNVNMFRGLIANSKRTKVIRLNQSFALLEQRQSSFLGLWMLML